MLYCVRTHSVVVNDAVNTWFSDQDQAAALAAAEKWFMQARVSNVSGTSVAVTVSAEFSNDGVNYGNAIQPISASVPAGATTVLFGGLQSPFNFNGAFMRVGVRLTGTAPNAFVDVWVCGRSAV